MYYPSPGGSVENIQGYDCQVPKVGWGKNRLTGKLEHVGIVKSSSLPHLQKWQRIELPDDYEAKRKIEELRQETDPDYFDTELEKIRQQHWLYRLAGVWIYINGKPVYIPPSFYYYLNWCKIDIGYPKYRDSDRKFYYVWEFTIEDPRAAGLIDVERRRMGKTYKSGSIILDRTSIYQNHHAGIQSKSSDDAKLVFSNTVVRFFKTIPHFFRPVYDQSKGMTPTSELRFFKTTVKGKRAAKVLEGRELGSWADYGPADIFHFDGSKLNTYVMDEFGKCLAKGTLIRMYNGEVKKVEDIQNGELVMGDDSTPRKVSGVASGKEMMYKVFNSRGTVFECNESHVLSLRWARRGRDFRGAKFNDIVNISVKEYLTLSPHDKKHLMLWKVEVDYKPKEHQLDPYFLGVWLGDGSKSRAHITNVEPEILTCLQETASEHGLHLVQHGIEYTFSTKSQKIPNILNKKLKNLNLILDKHIPDEYMLDSMENRLQLLAGLIDTDGYAIRHGGRQYASGYEITQKKKDLAINILELARSCGFSCTMDEKIARMVRKDGSIYSCLVYRMHIYGEMHRIPCRVERKKSIPPDAYHKNRRNPMRSGFKVEAIGEGDYYGFAVDGNHLFLLENYTVVHNTEEVSVAKRWDVVRFCLDQDGEWCGKALLTSTIEEMKGGTNTDAYELWKNSDPEKRNENGRTKTGLYRFFLPAYETTFFDEFGMPDKVKAMQHYINERDGLKDSPRELSSHIRKNPFTIEEAFRVDGAECLYNPEKLNPRYEWLMAHEDDVTEVGNFMWKDGIRLSSVVWSPNKSGRWRMGKKLKPGEANRIYGGKGDYSPAAQFLRVAGCDPFKYDKTKSNVRSDCGSYVYDMIEDRFLCEYLHRAPTTEMANEDILMMVWYYGVSIMFERNVDHWMKFFQLAGCFKFLIKAPDEHLPGLHTDGQGTVIQEICQATEAFIERHIDNCDFKNLIHDWLEFKVEETTKYDAAMGAGFALLGVRYRKLIKEEKTVDGEDKNDIRNYFRKRRA